MKMWLLWLVLVLIGAFFIGLAEVVVNKTKGKKSVSWFGRFADGVLKVIAKIYRCHYVFLDSLVGSVMIKVGIN
ncbi:hypothetical protein [Alicyclobacillus fastidiosus]|uniref:Uncharacterized protein n=1 Tax=Alicyclobacillus fastidiosus TaxID=392011 RepID=A0ABV5AKB9_9BACL|nr:hypothetical protein [Alicyclobacillus fastidiosus]WEH08450.1 hypothetical protein PYS47_17390 [Alicyclobacillus fastidiosus]